MTSPRWDRIAVEMVVELEPRIIVEVGCALAPCLDAAAGLMERCVALTMTVRDQNSELIGREVERVDLPVLTISLSGKALSIY